MTSAVRALGLDIGSKTVGIAVTDEVGIAAHPVSVLARRGTAADVTELLAIVERYQATVVVAGMPFELSGREGPRARRVRVLLDALRPALPAGVALVEQDERFTTAQAQRILLAADVSRARRKEVIDKQAAALILQGWLDRHKGDFAALPAPAPGE